MVREFNAIAHSGGQSIKIEISAGVEASGEYISGSAGVPKLRQE
jgi:hypothetical protein